LRVLALTSYPVEAACTRFRLTQFQQPLAERGITLELSPFLDEELFRRLYRKSEWPRVTSGLIRSLLRRLAQLPSMRTADVILLQREAMLLGPPLVEWWIHHFDDRPMVLDLDDATYLSGPSPTWGLFATLLKWPSKTESLIRWADLVLCGNHFIAAHAAARGRRTEVIPTIVDTEVFRPTAKVHSNAVPVIGWMGSHSSAVYIEKIFPALEMLARTYRFRLRVVGAGRPLSIPGVEVENIPWRMDREVEELQSLDIGLYPLGEDAWSAAKSGLKAVQYLAVGIPYVVTPIGAPGEIGEAGITHFTARTAEEWVQALSSLIDDPALRQRMGHAGRAHSLERYTVPRFADQMARALRSVGN
jgi:glycosyltransferase involved in cell wall biosynthesis